MSSSAHRSRSSSLTLNIETTLTANKSQRSDPFLALKIHSCILGELWKNAVLILVYFTRLHILSGIKIDAKGKQWRCTLQSTSPVGWS